VIYARVNWSKEIKKLHINVKELIIVLYGIKNIKKKLKGKKIYIQMNNKVVMSYLNRMIERMRHLVEIVKVIHLEVIEMGLSFYVIYIVSKENNITNAISRTKKYYN
jgi:hypothetical protein